MSLSHHDIYRLVNEPSGNIRADIVRKIITNYNKSSYTPKGNKIALDILRLLLKDTEIKVREALAEEIRHNRYAPHDVIISLADDEFRVAEHVLSYSEVLQESDLLEIINKNEDVRKLVTISQRSDVTALLSDALVDSDRPSVVKSLVSNNQAIIHDSTLANVIQEYREDQTVLEALTYRKALPFSLAETLFTLVSDQLRKQLTKRHLLPRSDNEKVSQNVREAAMLHFLSPWMSDDDVRELVSHMYHRGRLSDAIILRALCMGEITFFEVAMAVRVNIPVANARKLLVDPGQSGFSALYRSSKLPKEYREAVRVMLKLVREEIKDNNRQSDMYFQNMQRRIKSQHYHTSVENMDKVLVFLQRPKLISEMPKEPTDL